MKKLIVACAVWFACGSAAIAQSPPFPPGDDEDLPIELPAKPSGVFHGNYCGIGDNGPGLPPTDALDLACMHHDACTPAGGLPRCTCNARFQRETHAVVTDPRQNQDIRALAGVVEAAIPVIPCR